MQNEGKGGRRITSRTARPLPIAEREEKKKKGKAQEGQGWDGAEG